MRRMLNIRVERCFVLELHYAAKRIALSSRRNILAHMGLKKSRDEPLESGNFFRGSVLLSFRCPLFPLKCEYVKKHSLTRFLLWPLPQIERDGSGSSDDATEGWPSHSVPYFQLYRGALKPAARSVPINISLFSIRKVPKTRRWFPLLVRSKVSIVTGNLLGNPRRCALNK
jgi:hypothetical protein